MTHKDKRLKLMWGTYGRNPVLSTYTWVPVAKLADNHIKNILETQYQITKEFRKFLYKELMFRAVNGISIADVDHYDGQIVPEEC